MPLVLHRRHPRRPAPAWLLLPCLWALLVLAIPAQAQDILPGRYQAAGQTVTCELRPLPDGAWLFSLWQGGQAQPAQSEGFALSARLASQPGGNRLAGTWLSLPSSCCPGQGRLELEIISLESFRFLTFAPSLDQSPWPVRGQEEFHRVADLPPPAASKLLSGGWRVSLWYTDLLPQNAPADPQEGTLELAPQGNGAAGPWLGLAGQARLEPAPLGAVFTYHDQAAHFEIKADLHLLAQGLVYAGQFQSSLGEGQIRLTRLGLPVEPPDSPLAGQGELDGLWVDRRTGSDFLRIKGSARALEFKAYGGPESNPRYLSHGQARAVSPGLLEGQAKDDQGSCCGNQARLSLKVLDSRRIQAQAFWWPQGKPDPGDPLGEPYLLERDEPKVIHPAEASDDQWPEIYERQSGLLAAKAGAVRVRFTWQPQTRGQVATLFCQGGYAQELDLFIDQDGHLAARLATAGGLVSLASQAKVSPLDAHEAWLLYQAGGQLRLVLDGQAVAARPLAQPWLGSQSPYIVGASRWPLRDFEGAIDQVALWATPPDPQNPAAPSLTLESPDNDEPSPPADQTASTKSLLRLYHPGLLRHAYAVTQEQVQALEAQGYRREGSLGRLWEHPVAGGVGLWAFRSRDKGFTILQTQEQAPAGCEPLGLLGYVLSGPQPPSQPLYQLEGGFPDPLRGGHPQDMLYTSRADQLPNLRAHGYGPEKLVAHLAPESEPVPSPPATYTWDGTWGGDGWGHFHVLTQGHDLYLFWYYGELDGPHYLGHLSISPDGRQAQGLAVGQPGAMATYYRLELSWDLKSRKGPLLHCKSWRLAAPLDDGRLVKFRQPLETAIQLSKLSDQVPVAEAGYLADLARDRQADPAHLLEHALQDAGAHGRLLEK